MTVVITGAAGGVGRLLVPSLHRTHRLRLTDRITVDAPAAGATADHPIETVVGDLSDPAFAAEVTRGADAVVHLAGDPRPGDSWPRLRVPNADVVDNVLGAARTNRVRRVVLASSIHAMGGYVDNGRTPVREGWAPYPCCVYGAAKVLAESLARVWYDRFGLAAICLRLGAVRARPLARSGLPGWLSPADLGRLVQAALGAAVGYGIYHGVSANTDGWWDLSMARDELGYFPRDDSARYTDEVVDDLPSHGGPAAGPRARLLHRS